MESMNGKSRGKKSKPRTTKLTPQIVHCTLLEAAARNPEGYTVGFQKTPDSPMLFLQTAEVNQEWGGLIWTFVPSIDDAGLWDLEGCARILLRIRDDIPQAVAVAVV